VQRSHYETLDALRRVQSFLDAQTTAPRIICAPICARPDLPGQPHESPSCPAAMRGRHRIASGLQPSSSLHTLQCLVPRAERYCALGSSEVHRADLAGREVTLG
jgi:hypothetical protein